MNESDNWKGLIAQLPLRDYKYVFLAPVFNDYQCAVQLLQELNAAPRDQMTGRTLVLLVDDNSPNYDPNELAAFDGDMTVAVLRLRTNLGHQRAIATGLGYLSHWVADDCTVAVLDADGEDRPADAWRLLGLAQSNPGAVVVANRSERLESLSFRVGYRIYRRLYQLLTGHTIRHGNFCAMSGVLVRQFAYLPSLWNHIAATVFKSRIPVTTIEARRGKRYSGTSRMNLVSLTAHGLSAISVHIEAVGIRILVASVALGLLALISSLALLGVRLFTTLSIPGVISILTVMFALLSFLSMSFALQLVFSVLAARERKATIPAIDSAALIHSVQVIRGPSIKPSSNPMQPIFAQAGEREALVI